MSNKQKHKYMAHPVTDYEAGFLFTLYRKMGLNFIRQITAPTTPENCIGRIESLANIKDDYEYVVDVEDIELPYTFRVDVKTVKGKDTTTQTIVIGRVIPNPQDDCGSLIFLRTYLGGWSLTSALILVPLLLFMGGLWIFIEPLRQIFCYVVTYPLFIFVDIGYQILVSKWANDRIVRRLQLAASTPESAS